MTKILKNSQKRSNTFLQKYTLAEYINFEYKDTEFTNKIKDIFGNEFSIVEADARRIKRLRLQLSKKFKRENVDNK